LSCDAHFLQTAAVIFVGLIGIGQGIAGGRLIKVNVNRRDQLLEIPAILGQSRRPDGPIRLGDFCAAVQGEAEEIGLPFVPGNFLLGDLSREDVQAKDAIPNQIVLLAPGSRFIKCQEGMIPPISNLDPIIRIRPGQRGEVIGHRGIAAQTAQVAESGQA
jgi:hypothetical protein